MDLSDLKAIIAGVHVDYPQRQGLVNLHLDTIAQAILELEKMGHRVRLVMEDGPKPLVEWPKVLYHPEEAEPREVGSAGEEKKAKAEGWVNHPSGCEAPLASKIPPPPKAEPLAAVPPPVVAFSTLHEALAGSQAPEGGV